MKLALLGASGQIGQQILRQALSRGHHVTALARDPAKLGAAHPNLSIRTGDARRADDIAAILGGHDAVINAMGPGGPGVSDQNLDILTDGSRYIVAGMRAAGVRRLVVLGSVATLLVTPALMLRDAPNFPAFARNISVAHLQALRTYQAADLDWTVVCPPASVAEGQPTGNYRVRQDYVLENAGQPGILTGDLADFIVKEVEQGQHIGHLVNVAY